MATTPLQTVNIDDFVTGVLAACAVLGQKTLTLRDERLDRGAERAYTALKTESAARGLKLSFRIKRHPIHRDSLALRDAVFAAAQRGLVSLDNPIFTDVRLKIEKDSAEELFEHLPGTRDLYFQLAKELLSEN